jgi:hypothetical protein
MGCWRSRLFSERDIVGVRLRFLGVSAIQFMPPSRLSATNKQTGKIGTINQWLPTF